MAQEDLGKDWGNTSASNQIPSKTLVAATKDIRDIIPKSLSDKFDTTKVPERQEDQNSDNIITINGSTDSSKPQEGKIPLPLPVNDTIVGEDLGADWHKTEFEPKNVTEWLANSSNPLTKITSGDNGNKSSADNFIDNYNIPKAGITKKNADGTTTFTPFTSAELILNPHLDTSAPVEAFYRRMSGDNKTQDSNEVARNFLRQTAELVTKINDVPDLAPQTDFSLEGNRKYQEELNKADQGHNKAKAMGIVAAMKVAEEANKGNDTRAENILKDATLTVKVGDKSYRAMDTKAAQNTLEMEKIQPLVTELKSELDKIKPTDAGALAMAAPKFARVYAKFMNPTGDVSMGSIDETKMGNMVQDASEAGLNPTTAVVAVIDYVNRRLHEEDVSLVQVIKDYVSGVKDALDPSQAAQRMKTSLEAAEEVKDSYYKSGALIGYKGKPQTGTGGSDTEDKIPGDKIPTTKDWTDSNIPKEQKAQMIAKRLFDWTNSDEAELSGRKGASNLGVAKFQKMIKDEINPENHPNGYQVTGVINPDPNGPDQKAIKVYLLKNPTMTADDLVKKSFDTSYRPTFDDTTSDKPRIPKISKSKRTGWFKDPDGVMRNHK